MRRRFRGNDRGALGEGRRVARGGIAELARLGGITGATLLVLTVSAPAAATLPGSGRLEVGIAGGIFLPNDRGDYYGGGAGNPVDAPSASLALMCPVSPTAEAGLRLEYSSKRYDVDVARPGPGSTTYLTDHWAADAVGITLLGTSHYPGTVAQWGGVGFLSLGLGGYSLVGARYSNSLVDGELSLKGSGWGGFTEGGLEYPWPRRCPLSVALGFRFARIRPVRASGDLAGIPVMGDLPNDGGGQASIDHTAVYLRLSTRLRLWGAAADAGRRRSFR
jgi:hypothetical protein